MSGVRVSYHPPFNLLIFLIKYHHYGHFNIQNDLGLIKTPVFPSSEKSILQQLCFEVAFLRNTAGTLADSRLPDVW